MTRRLALSLALLALVSAGASAQRPGKLRQRPPLSPARPLLRRMVQAELNRSYVAREVVTREGGPSVEQWVKHDAVRGVRRERIQPPGEVSIDNGKRLWRINKKRVVEGESKLFQSQKHLRDLAGRLERGGVQLELSGQDTVAGRAADIVSVVLPGGDARRFWIDRETGLRLRTEERGEGGRIRASAYYLSLDPHPMFRDADFAPPSGQVVVKESPHRTFDSVEEAARAGVAVRIPGYLPAGYALRAIQESPTGDRLTLRFSNGTALLTLERLTNPPRRLLKTGEGFVPMPGVGRGYFWQSGGAGYLLLGPLPDAELRRVADSLR